MAKSKVLKQKTASDISKRVERILNELGHPEPPLHLETLRELLKLDLGYYSINDPTLLQDTVHKLKVAGKQIIQRPGILLDVVKKADIKALFIPDQKRILIDRDVPELKHRWNQAHEIGHSILPWHQGAMLGDDASTLIPSCHAQLECEANYAASKILFLNNRFQDEALDYSFEINSIKQLAETYGNTNTSTFWRCVETWGESKPIVGLITDHPHPMYAKPEAENYSPIRHFIQSAAFYNKFSDVNEMEIYAKVQEYVRAGKGGPLGGHDEVILTDNNNEQHVFSFESFSFYYSTLTLGVYRNTFANYFVNVFE